MPAGVSPMRMGGLPSRGCRVTVLVTNADSPSVPATIASSVPEPFTSGWASSIPQRLVRRSVTGRRLDGTRIRPASSTGPSTQSRFHSPSMRTAQP